MKYLGTITDENDIATKKYVDDAVASGGGSGSAVTGVKGNAETTYRTGQVNLTPANIGAATSGHTHTLASLGLTDLFVTNEQVLTNKSVAANTGFTYSATPTTISGYTPIGIAGYAAVTGTTNGVNVANIAVRGAGINDSGNLYCNGKNTGSAKAIIDIKWFVLYVKSTVM